MARDVKSDQFFLMREELLLPPFRHTGEAFINGERAMLRGRAIGFQGREDAGLALRSGALRSHGLIRGPIEDRRELRAPGSRRVERAGLDEAFQGALAELAHVHPMAEIKERDKGPAGVARLQDGCNRALADV